MYNFHVDNIQLQLNSFHSCECAGPRGIYISHVFHFQNENEIENKITKEIKNEIENEK